jgi:hypothetical protein
MSAFALTRFGVTDFANEDGLAKTKPAEGGLSGGVCGTSFGTFWWAAA